MMDLSHIALPEDMIENVEQAINKFRKKAQEDEVHLIFVTDPHHWIGGNQLKTAKLVQQVAKELPISCIVCGGDFSENGPKSDVVRMQKEIIDAFKVDGIPVLPAKGNHDDNTIIDHLAGERSIDNVIFPLEQYQLLYADLEQHVSFDKGNELGLYMYYDIPEQHTRVVVLNAIDIPYYVAENGRVAQNGQWEYGFSDRQINWVKQQVFNFSDQSNPERWKTVFFSHVSMVHRDIVGGDNEVDGGEKMWKVIKTNKARVHACFFGHVHHDQVVVKEGVPFISSLNAVTYGRKRDSFLETAFDIVSINISKNELRMIRVGAGEDRIIDLTKE
ncbi:metallophosphoesterase [Paenibacillus yanchengensis]|uniref:Metallophosphoesterase n=1 Tax=Paenibacillus yanchengensis TaxID=2035833 RepID=A0ABW4YGU4_9BACL